MKKLRMLKNILHQTHADKLLLTYLMFVLAIALVIWIFEPNITGYPDALWYCYEVISTIGFGDIILTTFIAKAASVLLTVFSLLIIAVVTGVVTNFYIQIVQLRQKDTVTHFVDKLERLPELSKSELEELSEKVKSFRK